MAFKIAICDDELSMLTQIDVYLNQIQLETGKHFEVFFFSSGEDLLDGMPRDVNVLLLDIQMKELSGIEAARKLRKEGADFFLFFITSNVQYALEGYEVHAYAFLRKPVQYVQLKKYLLEVEDRCSRSHETVLKLQAGNDLVLYNANDIFYIEVYGHAITVVTAEGRKTFQKPLSEVESVLCRQGFFRCHKSYLINLHRVKNIRALDIVMGNGDVLPLSKRRKGEFFQAIQSEIGG